jgi:GNAT superfamily N-acetyltransferase
MSCIDAATPAAYVSAWTKPGATRNRAPGPENYPRHLVESAWLRDGTPLMIRPIHANDFGLELDFILGLSRQSVYQRLLSPRKLHALEIRRLVRIDYARELALIATTTVDGKLRQVGVARYAPEPDSSTCDIAIVIADAWQGRGLGKLLLRALVGLV